MRIIFVVSIILALGLTACGRRASLDPPPGAGLTEPPKSFILDGLIKGL